MDPYCILTLGDQSVKGTICKKGGKRPFWDDIVIFRGSQDPVVTLELMDKDTLTSDDLIGVCEIDLQEVEDEGKVTKWYELHYKRKLAGEILIETTFTKEQEGPKEPLLYVKKKRALYEKMKGHDSEKSAARHVISYQAKRQRVLNPNDTSYKELSSPHYVWAVDD
jgi:Ca2+-dependent lipid-binding protein